MCRELLTTFGFLDPKRSSPEEAKGLAFVFVFDELRTNDNATCVSHDFAEVGDDVWVWGRGGDDPFKWRQRYRAFRHPYVISCR